MLGNVLERDMKSLKYLSNTLVHAGRRYLHTHESNPQGLYVHRNEGVGRLYVHGNKEAGWSA